MPEQNAYPSSPEASLHEASSRLQALLANHSLAIAEVAVDGSITLVSRALCHWLGVEPTSLVGHDITELMPVEDAATLTRQLERLAAGAIDSTAVAHRLRNAGGLQLWVRSSWTPRRGDDGAVSHVIAIIENIAREREDGLVRAIFEESIRGLEDRRRFIDRMLGALPVIVWRSLPNGVCDYLSSQWCSLTGMRDGTGHRWIAAIHPDDRRMFVAAWNDLGTGDGPRRVTCRVRRSDGTFESFEALGRPLRDEHGVLVAWAGALVPLQSPVGQRELPSDIQHLDLELYPFVNRATSTPDTNGLLS